VRHVALRCVGTHAVGHGAQYRSVTVCRVTTDAGEVHLARKVGGAPCVLGFSITKPSIDGSFAGWGSAGALERGYEPDIDLVTEPMKFPKKVPINPAISLLPLSDEPFFVASAICVPSD
jgi:hypothetical protein